MSNLISGKEALDNRDNAQVSYTFPSGDFRWFNLNNCEFSINQIINEKYEDKDVQAELRFRLKPRTITLNGIEVPAPFEPKEGEDVWCISDYQEGWVGRKYGGQYSAIGYWRTEDEIKQVVATLRKVFGDVIV